MQVISLFKTCALISISLFGLACNNDNDIPAVTGKPDTDPADTVKQSAWDHDSPLPFDLPTIDILRASDKKVFAHYFTQFPISIDNNEPGSDYYQTGYLSPNGENNKHLSYGGYLRVRPLPRKPVIKNNWLELDMEEEVRRAISLGLDGFACDLLSHEGYHFERVKMLMEATGKIDPGFKIMLMPDMEAFKDKADKLTGMITTLSSYCAAYRLEDGRLVISPFNAQNKSPMWWEEWLVQMKTDGTDIAFVPLFQDWKSYAQDFAPFSYGMSDWGWRSVTPQNSWKNTAKEAQAYGTIWMMPVSPQDMRPRDQRYWEAGNSEEYRVMWENAINGGSDWVQIITWNDYAEHTIIAPSTGTQYAFYDLSAYYITWFKTNIQPAIKRDVLYYFYRVHRADSKPARQAKPFVLAAGSDSPSDQIELLAFLTEPGTLEIEIMGKKSQKHATAGINVLKVPVQAGRPVFRLIRDDKEVIVLPGAFKIKSEINYQNLMYYGGSNSRMPVVVSD